MNNKIDRPKTVAELIDSASTIKKVDTPAFFKDRVLNELSKPVIEETQPLILNWFSPKLQLAALFIFAFINIAALLSYANYNESENVQTFAETYGFSSSDDQSILN